MLQETRVLEVLYDLLKKRHLHRAALLFGENSDLEHARRFNSVVASMRRVVFVGEYIVVEFGGFFSRIAVVGVDDSGRLFVHILRSPQLVVNDDIDSVDIRRAMGFDVHLWEFRRLEDGISIRLQGDIVIRVVRVYDSLDSLLNDLDQVVVNVAIDDFIDILVKELRGVFGNPRVRIELNSRLRTYLAKHPNNLSVGLEEFINTELLPATIEALEMLYKMRRKVQENRSIFRLLLMRKTFVRELYGLGLNLSAVIDFIADVMRQIHEEIYNFVTNLTSENYIRDMDVYLRKTLDFIANQEQKIRFLLGRHTIRVIGIPITRLIDFGFRAGSFDFHNTHGAVLLLREQKIIAIHPQHGVAHLRINKPCIIEVSTIGSASTAGVTRISVNIVDDMMRRFKVFIDEKMRLGATDRIQRKILNIADYGVRTLMESNDFKYDLGGSLYYAIMRDIARRLASRIATTIRPKLINGNNISRRKLRKMFQTIM